MCGVGGVVARQGRKPFRARAHLQRFPSHGSTQRSSGRVHARTFSGPRQAGVPSCAEQRGECAAAGQGGIKKRRQNAPTHSRASGSSTLRFSRYSGTFVMAMMPKPSYLGGEGSVHCVLRRRGMDKRTWAPRTRTQPRCAPSAPHWAWTGQHSPARQLPSLQSHWRRQGSPPCSPLRQWWQPWLDDGGVMQQLVLARQAWR